MSKTINEKWEYYLLNNGVCDMPNDIIQALKDVFHAGAFAMLETTEEAARDFKKHGNNKQSTEIVLRAREEIHQYLDRRRKELKHDTTH